MPPAQRYASDYRKLLFVRRTFSTVRTPPERVIGDPPGRFGDLRNRQRDHQPVTKLAARGKCCPRLKGEEGDGKRC